MCRDMLDYRAAVYAHRSGKRTDRPGIQSSVQNPARHNSMGNRRPRPCPSSLPYAVSLADSRREESNRDAEAANALVC